jgi:RNA polymerase-binding protein DksA
MNQSGPAELRERLEMHKAELVERISKIRADVGGGLEADSSEQATQLENMEVLNALVQEGEDELGQIKAALRRLDDDTFGACVTCGEAIGHERLEARPYSSECIKCASSHD